MECMALVSRGIEDVACTEIAEIIGAKCRQEEGCVLFSAKKIEDMEKRLKETREAIADLEDLRTGAEKTLVDLKETEQMTADFLKKHSGGQSN